MGLFDLSLYTVKAVLILDNEGKRVFAKYYTAPHDPSAIPQFNSISKSLETTKKGTSSKTSSNTTHTTSDSASLAASVKEQKAFEKELFAKTNKQNADILLFNDLCVVAYKQVVDFTIYVVGADLDVNELMLYRLVMSIKDSIYSLFNENVDRRALMENYDQLILVIDEAVDSGIILETDFVNLSERVSKAPANEPILNNIELSEQGLLNVYQFARGKLSEKLRQQFQ